MSDIPSSVSQPLASEGPETPEGNATKRARKDWRYEFERVVSRENEKRVAIVTANLDVAMKRTRASLDFPHKGGAGVWLENESLLAIRFVLESLIDVRADLAAARSLLSDAQQDSERLDWIEAHDFSAMCWNVSEDTEHDRWAAPMKPNNGWTIGVARDEDDDSDDPQGTTLRDAIDWAKKCAASSTPRESAPSAEDSTPPTDHPDWPECLR